jgi:hypothetical protein
MHHQTDQSARELAGQRQLETDRKSVTVLHADDFSQGDAGGPT